MPIYPYTCQNCGEEITRLHKFEETPDPCDCGSTDLTRKFAAPAIRMGGRQSMSVRHTTSEYFGPQGSMAKEEYFPEERKAKAQEAKKKEDSKGVTIAVSRPSNKKK